MKTAFCCLNMKLRAASSILLRIHWIIFAGTLLLATISMSEFWCGIMLVFVLVSSAGIVSLDKKKSMNITLSTGTVILLVVAFLLAILITLANLGSLLFVGGMEEWADIIGDDSSDIFGISQFSQHDLVQYIESSYFALFVFDLIAFFVIAFYVYSASVLNSYRDELKRQPLPSVIFSSAPGGRLPTSHVPPYRVPSYSHPPAVSPYHGVRGLNGIRLAYDPYEPQHHCTVDKTSLL